MSDQNEMPPIEALHPDKELHPVVLQYLIQRLDMSERKMSRFYARWRVREQQLQAYIDLPKYDKQLKEMNESGAPPVITALTIPYAYSTISTIATYMTHAFTGRKPIFQTASNNAAAAQAAPNMETVLQYQSDSRFMIKRWMQFFKDAETYGVAAMKNFWEVEKRLRTVRTSATMLGEGKATRELRTVYEGNELENIDPFMFFPDPRVPMSEVSQRGEFVFWREFTGKHELHRDMDDFGYRYLDNLGAMPQNVSTAGVSARSLVTGGEPHPGAAKDSRDTNNAFVQKDECSIWIIPSKLVNPKTKKPLGKGTRPELWLFTIINKKKIIRAIPLEYDHGQHPIVTVEPHSVGYGFGHMSTADYLSPLQDAASWFLNSHIYNVRSVLNNMFVVNPAMVEMSDIRDPKPGKVIRLKRSAMGQDVRTAIFQLQTQDVTRSHVQDLEAVIRMGDMLSSVNDNLRGIQDSGGRKTATEVRTAGEAGASRLAAQARMYSAQAFSPLAMQMSLNTQQFLSTEMEMRILGTDKTIMIGPEQLVGDYYFPIHDGTLPLDKVALLDVWKEILLGCSRDMQLRQEFNIGKIFEWTAELGGAKNIESFRNQSAGALPGAAPGQPQVGAINIAPPGFDPTNGIAAGNLIPTGAA